MDIDAITRRVEFRNVYPIICPDLRGPKTLQRVNSLTIDFEASTSHFHMIQLSGSWARERQVVETKLTHGTQSFGSLRGVSSHQHNPFAGIYFIIHFPHFNLHFLVQ